MKKIIWVIVGAILALLLYVAAGPFMTVSALKTAVAKQDTAALATYVDFPSLRRNLRGQMSASIAKNLTSASQNNPLVAMMSSLAGKFLGKMLDTVITPQGLAHLMQGKQLTNLKDSGNNMPLQKNDLLKNARFTYDSLNQFSVWVPDRRGKEARFVLHRYWLSWKLVNYIAP